VSYQIKCDRCGDVYEFQIPQGAPNMLPSGWSIADGCHLCSDCDKALGEFMQGNSIPLLEKKL
jgi:hypothetical protein